MSWVVVMGQLVYCIRLTLEEARLLEAQELTVPIIELLASRTPLDLSEPLVLHGTHKLIVL